jgi:toxin ParE1/3/4
VTRRIVVERAAEEDLFAAVDYYMRQGTPATARRFVTAARATFARLAETHDIGHRYQTTHPRLQHLHIWRVHGFNRYLIFYHATEQTLFIERVLHGARNIEWILAGEDD